MLGFFTKKHTLHTCHQTHLTHITYIAILKQSWFSLSKWRPQYVFLNICLLNVPPFIYVGPPLWFWIRCRRLCGTVEGAAGQSGKSTFPTFATTLRGSTWRFCNFFNFPWNVCKLTSNPETHIRLVFFANPPKNIMCLISIKQHNTFKIWNYEGKMNMNSKEFHSPPICL